MMQRPVKKNGPPGIIATLSAGFELTTSHLWLLILPITLDVFYWLGPRLSIQNLVKQNAALFSGNQSVAAFFEQTIELASRFNLFTSLSLPLIGIPALMNGPTPVQTPLTPAIYEIEDPFTWLLLFAVFTLLGLTLTAFYLNLIAGSLRDAKVTFHFTELLGATVRNSIGLLFLGILFVFMAIGVTVPLLPVALLLGQFSGGLFTSVLTLGVVLIVTFLCFSVPGIVLNKQSVTRAIIQSIQIVRQNLLSTITLLLLLFLIGSGMNILWLLADYGSWLTLVSIAGHAFINTALYGTLFVFYQTRLPAVFANART